jgi:predicted lipoprotein with Yx(FWY)xxD motif
VRKSMSFLIPMLTSSLLIAACGSSYSSSSSSAPASTQASSSALVKTAANASLGARILVNAQGMTLYRLSGEGAGHFICTSAACVGVWHPLVAASASGLTGVASLGRVSRPDGTLQVTYKGMPLYTFAQDSKEGDTKGQGFKDVGTWNAISTGSSSSSAPASPSSTEAPPSGGSRY